MVNNASQRYLLPGYSFRRNLYCAIASLQDLVIVEAPPHLDQRFGNGDHAGIGLGRSGRAEIDVAIGIDNALVVVAGAFSRRASIERFAHAIGGGKVVSGPGFAVMRTGVRLHSGRATNSSSTPQRNRAGSM